MQQFAISEATLFGWNSMDGESIGAGSNHGSVAHLSEVNQESITSRGTAVWFELVLGGTFDVGSDWTEVFRFLDSQTNCGLWPFRGRSRTFLCYSAGGSLLRDVRMTKPDKKTEIN